jgi:hypothetical protein
VNEETWAKMQQYLDAAAETSQMLVDACRENNPAAGGHIVKQLFDKQDITYTMLVIGRLTTRVVAAERRAGDARGPIVTPEEMGESEEPVQPWQTSVMDQMEAAAQADDIEEFARVSVDAQLRSFDIDADNGYTVDFAHILKQMLMLNQYAVAVSAAEMARRLREGADSG